jgi:transcriptional regulator
MLHERAHYTVADERLKRQFIAEHPFALLITVREGVCHTTHLTLIEDGDEGLVLKGHLNCANPQAEGLEGSAEAVFRGPHGYVSPLWYDREEAVPTWNYAVVHVLGEIELITDRDETRMDIERLVNRFEPAEEFRWREVITDSYVEQLLDHLRPFRMRVHTLQAQFKLSQDKTAADRAGVMVALAGSERADDRALARLMADWYGAEAS